MNQRFRDFKLLNKKIKDEEIGLGAKASNNVSSNTNPDSKSLTERSINSLQWFYTIILSLAIVKVITQFITSSGDVIKFENGYLLNFIVFMILAIPFHQGANQYLNAAYLTKKYQIKKWTGLVDFLFFFIEGMVFYAMAIMFINKVSFFSHLIIVRISTSNFAARFACEILFRFRKSIIKSPKDPYFFMFGAKLIQVKLTNFY